MEPALDYATLSDTCLPHVLYDHFWKQATAARRYGHTSWLLLRWSPDVWYAWGLSSPAAEVRRRLEAQAPVTVTATQEGLRVRVR